MLAGASFVTVQEASGLLPIFDGQFKTYQKNYALFRNYAIIEPAGQFPA